MNHKSLIYTLLVTGMVVFLFRDVSAQGGSIRGTVIDASTQERLPGATILLQKPKGQASELRIGRRSGSDGTFNFNDVPTGKYILKVSYLGYKGNDFPVEVTTGESVADIKMTPDVKGMEEVVVVGEAQQRFKSESEVAVSKVNVAELSKANSYENLSQILSGRVPGLRITPGSGTVGGGIRFDVRSGAGLFGSGQPVIYIDGVRIVNTELGPDLTGGQLFSSISDINPDDIQDIQILKGPAAAALYGTSGSNGVILIKTKHGATGTSIENYNYQYKVTSGWNEQAEAYTADNALTFKDANATFRTGPFTEHEVSLAGNTPTFNYYAAFGRRNEDGIQYNNSFERNSLRGNFSAFPSDKITINASTNYVISQTSLPQNDNNILGALGGTLLFGPTDVGGYGPYAGADSILGINIVTLNNSRRFLGSIEGLYKPISELTFRASVGYDGLAYRLDYTLPANLDYSAFGITGGERLIQNNFEDRLNLDLSAAFNWDLGESMAATTTAGMQLFYDKSTEFDFAKSEFPTSVVTNIGAGNKFLSGDEILLDTRTAGLFLSQDFIIDNTYFFSAGIRNEYASAIGEKAPSIFYPRVSGAVRFDKLGFPQDFDLFKFRVAYGQSGVLPGSLDASGLRWGAAPSGSGTGAVVKFIGNEAIEPERIAELEIGLDLELNNRYGLDFTYFMQNATNSIVTFVNGPSTGLTASATPKNVGSIDGSGIEANIYGRVFQTRDYQLDLSLIWNYANNKVTSLGGAPPIFSGENAVVEGQPRASFYTFAVRDALFNADGTYAGPNQDTGRSFLGNPVSPTSGSFSINFRFLKDFTLNVLTDWAFGGTIRNGTRAFQTYYGNDKEYNRLINQLGLMGDASYISAGFVGDTTIAPLQPGSDAYKAAANRIAQLDPNAPGAIGFYESSDFIRLREVSLRYDMSSLISDALPNHQIKTLSISLGVRNATFLMKKYSGPDVELSTAAFSEFSIYRGQDFLTLQNPRIFYGTITIGF